MKTHMNEDVGECMSVGYNSERGMDPRFLWGQDNSLPNKRLVLHSEGRDWDLGLFTSKLAVSTITVHCHYP